jgi:type IV pilus assembly protein PilC
MRFKYSAKTKEGELQMGFVEAADKDAAISVLTSHALFIMSMQESQSDNFVTRLLSYFGRVKSGDVMVFARQLATLLEAHLPLSHALRILEEQTQHPGLREVVRQVSADVASGLTFSQALSRHDTVFSRFFVSMIQSAEVTGTMDEAAMFLADYLEKENSLISRARSALIYPGIVLGLFLVVGGIMITVVFPQIGPVFEQSGVHLPWYTRMLLFSGTLLSQWWPVLFFLTAILGLAGLNYLRTQEGKAMMDEVKIRMPILNKLFIPLTITRLANVMSMLLRGGVPVTQSVQIAGLTVNNAVYQELMNIVAADVESGKPLSAALDQYPDYFPPLVAQMLVVGEATGQIDKMFQRVSDFYGRQTDAAIGNMVDLIQPVLMILIGGSVGLLFASLLMPLYQLTSSIQ